MRTTLTRAFAAVLTTLAVSGCSDAPPPVAPVVPSAPSLAKGGPKALPTNGRIFFTSDITADYEVYSMNPDGSDRRRLTYTTESEGWLDVSRDGKKLVVLSGTLDGGRIHTMNADGTNRRLVLSLSDLANYPAWSPDGRTIAYTAVSASDPNLSAIWTISPNGGKATQLTNASAQSASWPSWSPDGSKIVYVAYTPATGDVDLYIMNADGSAPGLLHDCVEVCLNPAWAPDGMRIYYSVSSAGASQVRYCAMKHAGPEPICDIKPETDVTATMFDLSPDGSRFVFISHAVEGNDVIERLGIADVNGSAQTTLETGDLWTMIHMAWGR